MCSACGFNAWRILDEGSHRQPTYFFFVVAIRLNLLAGLLFSLQKFMNQSVALVARKTGKTFRKKLIYPHPDPLHFSCYCPGPRRTASSS
jgi:hypothetical protein